MADHGYVKSDVSNGVATLVFFHPKKNSLPAKLLAEMTAALNRLGADAAVKVVVLKSGGEGPFCAGASFEELLAISDLHRGKEFFMGFARLILAMRACPKFIVVRAHGKVVGGGVGIVSAADYTLATSRAAIKLSELALGIGPFVVGPAVERKIGSGQFSALAIDTDWRSAKWARMNGMYADIFEEIADLDAAVDTLARKLAGFNPEAMAALKTAAWRGTDDWPQLLEARAEMSGRLVLSEFTSNAISAFKQK